MPTQARTWSKEHCYPSNPEVHISQTMVIVTAIIKVQAVINLCLVTTAVYQDEIILHET
jgi:hypothetical protein